MKIRFLYNFLFINDCKEILFPLGIKGLIQLEELVIVFIYGSTSEEMELVPANNVYAFNEEGKKVWQIEEPVQSKEGSVSYADISLNENGEVIAGTTRGNEYVVSITDGSVRLISGQRPW